jgi:hypothetical protein
MTQNLDQQAARVTASLDQLADTLSMVAEALREAHTRPYGPEPTPEDIKAAGAACVALCHGDVDQARTLWRLIVNDLGAGYMPKAATIALVRAANTTNLIADVTAPEYD